LDQCASVGWTHTLARSSNRDIIVLCRTSVYQNLNNSKGGESRGEDGLNEQGRDDDEDDHIDEDNNEGTGTKRKRDDNDDKDNKKSKRGKKSKSTSPKQTSAQQDETNTRTSPRKLLYEEGQYRTHCTRYS
jgi:Mg-chelatase subunit ChlI